MNPLSQSTRMKISIVTPCLNELDSIENCYAAIRQIFDSDLREFDYEHIFCDNDSRDGTVEVLKKLAAADRRVKLILNSRNFGPFNSMFNGLRATSGDLIIPLFPADLQDPPDVIPRMVDSWRKGSDVVFGVRATREEAWFLRVVRSAYYRLVNRWANIYIPLNVGEFTLITRQVADSITQVDDYYPYLRGLIANAGFKTSSVSYVWRARSKGVSKNSIYRLVDQGLNGLISFTNIPMRLMMLFGGIISVFSVGYAFITFIWTLLARPELAAPGIQTLIVGMFFFSGLILFSLGVIGEYVSAIHFQVRRRPLVIERERVNF